jgi:L-rhamnose mutarotase
MRQAFRMKLKEGCEVEYERRHRAIWPEVKALLSESGVSDYSIYLDKETGFLFAFQRCEDGKGSQDIGDKKIIKKWWHYMKDLMDTNDDESPVSVELHEVFHMD